MKKFLSLLFAVMFILSAQAQLFDVFGVGVGYFYVGPKLGGNASFNSIDAGSGVDKKANYGYQLGGIGKLGITKKLAIQTEFLYTSKGYTKNNTFMSMTTKSNFNYIGLPIIAKYAFAAISGIDIYGSGGFYTDVLTGVEFKMLSDTSDIEYDESEYYNENLSTFFKRVDFGLSVGAGANIPIKNGDILNIDLRYTYGLTDVNKQGANASTTSSRNMSIQLSAIYLLDLTKWVHFKGSSSNNDAYEEDNSVPVSGAKVDR